MEAKTKYIRKFFIFSPQDKGFGNGKEPEGYVRLEATNGKGKLQLSVQNLKESREREYRLYMVQCLEEKFIPVSVGVLKLEKGRASFSKEFDPIDFEGSGIRAEDFNGAVILAQSTERIGEGFACPLADCKDMKVNWKEQLTKSFSTCEKNSSPMDDITSRYDFKIESKIPVDKDILQEKVQDIEEYAPTAQEEESMEEVLSQAPVKDDFMRKPIQDDLKEEKSDKKESDSGFSPIYNGTERSKFPFPLCIEGGCNHSCAVCSANMSRYSPVRQTLPLKISIIRRYLNNYFEACYPFKPKRKDYEWWKVDSPVNLNNILYQFGIHEPQFFSPQVLAAYFKYRHLVAGLYIDRLKKRECLVFGVPVIYGIDPNPLEDRGIWVQVEGHGAKYGAFGYWLIYLDLKK